MKKIILSILFISLFNNSYPMQYNNRVIANKSIKVVEMKRETIFGIFTGTMVMFEGYHIKPVLLPENYPTTIDFCRYILGIEPSKFYSILRDNLSKIKAEMPIIMSSEDGVEFHVYLNPYTIGYVSENKLFFVDRDGLLRIISVID